MEQEKLQKLARKGPSTREHAPTSPSSAVSDVKAAGGAGPASSASTSESTNKNRNYAVLAGTIVGLSAMGWYLLSKEPKKTEEVASSRHLIKGFISFLAFRYVLHLRP